MMELSEKEFKVTAMLYPWAVRQEVNIFEMNRMIVLLI